MEQLEPKVAKTYTRSGYLLPPGYQVADDGESFFRMSVAATWFGGPNDPGDSGETASGISTKKAEGIIGCALPIPTSEATRNSGWPVLKWGIKVKLTRRDTMQQIVVPLIDVGPTTGLRSGAGVDLTPATFAALGVPSKRGRPVRGSLIVIVEVWPEVQWPSWPSYRKENAQ